MELTGKQLKKWVINLSKYKLSEHQNKILAKRLNYAVTPEKVKTEEFVVAAEQAKWSFPQYQKDKFRADIAGVLKSAKTPKPNLSRQERTALKEPQKDTSITILTANKEKPTFVTETKEYQEKIKEILNDQSTDRRIRPGSTRQNCSEETILWRRKGRPLKTSTDA